VSAISGGHRPPLQPNYATTIAECALTAEDSAALLLAMSDTPASLPPQVVGAGYDYETIRAALGGQTAPPYFVIHRDGVIVGLCLGLIWNPLAESDPAEVWVGRKGDLPNWGAKLAGTTGPLPVYVRRAEGGQWFYTGMFEVSGSTTEATTIQHRLKPPITAISRIVYLKRAANRQDAETAKV
jgi:hypothetical protein